MKDLYAQVQASGFRVKMQTSNLFHIHASMMHQSHRRVLESVSSCKQYTHIYSRAPESKPLLYTLLKAVCPAADFTWSWSCPLAGFVHYCGHLTWPLNGRSCPLPAKGHLLWLHHLNKFVLTQFSLLLFFSPIKLFIFSLHFLLRIISSSYFPSPIE